MTFAEYQAIPAINATAIKAGAQCMRYMRYVMEGGKKKPTDSMKWGTMIHGAVLSPEEFLDHAAIWTGPVKRGKAYDDFKSAHADAVVLSQSEWEELQKVYDVVMGHRKARALLEGSEHEKTILWERPEYGPAKARLDGLSEHCVIEVKTTTDISQDAFGKQFCGPRGAPSNASLGYDIQCAWYSEGAGGLPVKIIAVRSEPPYDVAVYPVPSLALKIGGKKARDIAVRYRDCERAGVFPGVAPDDETELRLPDYYITDDIVGDLYSELAADQL